MNSEKFALPPSYKQCDSNLWKEYMDIVMKYKALNLGHGAPDFTAPKVLSDTLEKVSKGTDPVLHQYARDCGTPRLVNILSKLYSPMFKREISAMDEVIITNGAMEALYCTIMGFINPGDEVIIIEPFYVRYEYLIKIAGGTPRFIPLRPKKDSTSKIEWVLDYEELASMFNSKTKMIIVNTPHNPTGKVFNESELQKIADLCIKWDVLCIADEVYEWLVYKPLSHFRIATLPGMWDRTLTIGSAGKTFSATGWRIGWVFGRSCLLHNLRVVHQNIVNSCGAPMQDALARALEHEESVLGTEDSLLTTKIVESFEKKRDYFVGVLKEVGMEPAVPDAGYFMLADWTKLASKADLESETDIYRDYRFTKWMGKNIGLMLFPLSPFYSEANKHLGEDFVRLCFIKEDENLEKAANILRNWKKN